MVAMSLRQAQAIVRAHQAKQDKVERVIWLDRGWQPVYIGFCPTKVAWKRAMKGLKSEDTPYPNNDGCVTRFKFDGKVTAIVTLGDVGDQSRVSIAGLLAHEATHVWQMVREAIGENEPSAEFEAYSIQCIFVGLYQAWLDTRAPDAMKAACAKRVRA